MCVQTSNIRPNITTGVRTPTPQIKSRLGCLLTEVFDRYSRKKRDSSQSNPSDLGANVDILSDHLHCLDWEVSRCKVQHLGFEPVTCLPVSWGISVDRQGPKLFISCFGLQQTLGKLHSAVQLPEFQVIQSRKRRIRSSTGTRLCALSLISRLI